MVDSLPRGPTGTSRGGAVEKARSSRPYDAALSAQQTTADAVQDVGDIQVATISHVSPALIVADGLVIEIELTSALTGGNARLISVELREQ